MSWQEKKRMKDLEIGGIYLAEWDKRPLRIIGLDNVEVFYDCLWPRDNSWMFSGNFRKKCYFYRTSSETFVQKSHKKGFAPITVEEHKFFRPDLLMRIGRIKDLSWNEFEHTNFQTFKDHIHSGIIDQRLEAREIVVVPYGLKGGLKKGEKLMADNNEFFTVPELIWKAKMVQEAVNPIKSNGIGLYRIGFEKGLPSYYIGEYFDKAGLLKV